MGIRSYNSDNENLYNLGVNKDSSSILVLGGQLQSEGKDPDQQKKKKSANGVDEGETGGAFVLGSQEGSPNAAAPNGGEGAEAPAPGVGNEGNISLPGATPPKNNPNAVPMSMAALIILAFFAMAEFANEIAQQQNELAIDWARAVIGVSMADYGPGSTETAQGNTTLSDGTKIPNGDQIKINQDGSITDETTGKTYTGVTINFGSGSTITDPKGNVSTIPDGSFLLINKDGSLTTLKVNLTTDEAGHTISSGLAGTWFAAGVDQGQEQKKGFEAQETADIVGAASAGTAFVIGTGGMIGAMCSGPSSAEIKDAQARVNELGTKGTGLDAGELETVDENDPDVSKDANAIKAKMAQLKSGVDENHLASNNDGGWFKGGKLYKKSTTNDEQRMINKQAVEQLRKPGNQEDLAEAQKAAKQKLDSLQGQKNAAIQNWNMAINLLNMAQGSASAGGKAYGDSVQADTSAAAAIYQANSNITQQTFQQVDGARDKSSQDAKSSIDLAKQALGQNLQSALQAMTSVRG